MNSMLCKHKLFLWKLNNNRAKTQNLRDLQIVDYHIHDTELYLPNRHISVKSTLTEKSPCTQFLCTDELLDYLSSMEKVPI